jgi:CIC family chloride channel protein
VFTDDRDRNILSGIVISRLIQSPIQTLKLAPSLEVLVEKISGYNQMIFPIVNDKNELLGIIDFEEVKSHLFNPYKIKYTAVKDIMHAPKEIINYDETAETIVEKFERAQTDYLLVLKNKEVIGIITKNALLEAYREKLKNMIIE